MKKYKLVEKIDQIYISKEEKIYIFLGAGEVYKLINSFKEKVSKIY